MWESYALNNLLTEKVDLMTNFALRVLKATIKQLTVLLVSVAIFLSITPTAVLASSPSMDTKPRGTPGITAPIPGENVSELKEQRREWQEKESSHNENDKGEGESLGETLVKKLNLNEIKEGYDPHKDAEKGSSLMP
jgi:hypothetical protein